MFEMISRVGSVHEKLLWTITWVYNAHSGQYWKGKILIPKSLFIYQLNEPLEEIISSAVQMASIEVVLSWVQENGHFALMLY